jgi:hypothetical protein
MRKLSPHWQVVASAHTALSARRAESEAIVKTSGYDADHVFTLVGNPHYGFATGRAPQEQVLVTFAGPNLLAVCFDAAGRLLKADTSVLHEAAAPVASTGGCSAAAQQRAGPWATLRAWEREHGLMPGPIRVRRFFLDRYGLGIRDLPSEMREVAENPSQFCGEEYATVWEDIAAWVGSGQFVFLCNGDYFMDRDGRVVSS